MFIEVILLPDTLYRLSYWFPFSPLENPVRWVFLQFEEEEMDIKRLKNVPKVTELQRGGKGVYFDLPTIRVPCTAVGSYICSNPEQLEHKPETAQIFQQQGGHGDLGS